MIKLGFIVPENGHETRGIGTYAKNIVSQFKKNKQIIVEEISSFDEVSSEMDLVHVPFFDLFFKTLPAKLKKPTIITIHDVIPLIFTKNYPPGFRGKLRFQFQKYALKNISAVITPSNFSKKDIVKYLNIPADKIFVTYLSASKDFRVIKDKVLLDQVKKRYKLPEKFVLFAGSVNWNKNISAIAQASLAADVEAVFIGKSFQERMNLDHPEMVPFKQFLEKYEFHPNIRILGFVPNEDFVPIVNLASIMMLPSHYEGFGLPILEAQACGVPVIAGNNSSIVEVAGNSAILVDSNNIHEMTESIKKLMTDQEARKKLVDLGFKNIKRFSWEKCAEETIKVYQKILSKTS